MSQISDMGNVIDIRFKTSMILKQKYLIRFELTKGNDISSYELSL